MKSILEKKIINLLNEIKDVNETVSDHQEYHEEFYELNELCDKAIQLLKT